MSEPCTLCTPWPDGGCDFGCPCRDCDEGRKYEAFVTNPHRETPSAAECHAYMEWLRGGELVSDLAYRKSIIDANAWRWPDLTIFADPTEYNDVRIRLSSLPESPQLTRRRVMIDDVALYAFVTAELNDALAIEETYERADVTR